MGTEGSDTQADEPNESAWNEEAVEGQLEELEEEAEDDSDGGEEAEG